MQFKGKINVILHIELILNFPWFEDKLCKGNFPIGYAQYWANFNYIINFYAADNTHKVIFLENA